MTLAKKTMTLVRGLQVATVGVVALAANPIEADAAVIGSNIQGGYINQPKTPLELTIIDPPPKEIFLATFTEPNPHPTRDIFGIIEKQSVVLPKSVELWDKFDKDTSNFNVTIPQNTIVSSYLFYVSAPGPQPGTDQAFEWSGQIIFDTPILGIVSRQWRSTHQLVALDNTEYHYGGGLDGHPLEKFRDVVTFEDNVVNFFVSARTGSDGFRVITSGSPVTPAVPEPLTILGTGTALGFIPLLKGATSGKQRKAKKKE